MSALEVQLVGDSHVVHALGDLDMDGVLELENALERLREVANRIVVDLGACSFCGSEALGLIAKFARLFETRFYVVLPASPSVRRVFEITNFTRLPFVVASLRDAVAA